MDRIDLAHAPPRRVAGLTIEPARGVVCADDGREQTLQPQVMRVLLTLLEADGATLSRDDLRRRCWSGRTVGEDAVDRVIGQIRRINGELGRSFTLETIPKVGYRLLPAAEPDRGEAPSPRMLGRRSLLALSGATLAAGAIGGGVLLFRHERLPVAAGPGGPLRIAVLLPDSADADLSVAALARGLLHDIRAALARIDGVAVVGAETAGDGSEPVPDTLAAARRLGATLAIDGTITLAGATLRTAIDLLSAVDGTIVTTLTHTAASADRLALRDEIVAALIPEVAGLVAPEQVVRRAPNYTRDPVVVRHVAEAQQQLEQTRTLRMDGREAQALDTADAAFDHLRHALSIDPDDPGALVAMAALVKNGWTRAMAREQRTSAQRLAASEAYLLAALMADPNDPGALTAVADGYRRYEWRWREAENLLRRALAAAPDLIEAHWSYAYLLGTQGRCREGLKHAQLLFPLAPGSPWRRVAMPRLLYMVGRRDKALAHYQREQARAPGNVFLIRERYVMHLAEGDAAALLRLAREIEILWQGRAIPEAIARLIQRARAGAQATAGSPADLARIVASDLAAYDAAPFGPSSTVQGRASVDLLFLFALEFGWAGQPSRAIDLLERALGARSLYWPSSLPYGSSEFPPVMRNDPRYAMLWNSDPRLAQLIAARRHSVLTGEMVGVLPNGRRVSLLAGE